MLNNGSAYYAYDSPEELAVAREKSANRVKPLYMEATTGIYLKIVYEKQYYQIKSHQGICYSIKS